MHHRLFTFASCFNRRVVTLGGKTNYTSCNDCSRLVMTLALAFYLFFLTTVIRKSWTGSVYFIEYSTFRTFALHTVHPNQTRGRQMIRCIVEVAINYMSETLDANTSLQLRRWGDKHIMRSSLEARYGTLISYRILTGKSKKFTTAKMSYSIIIHFINQRLWSYYQRQMTSSTYI